VRFQAGVGKVESWIKVTGEFTLATCVPETDTVGTDTGGSSHVGEPAGDNVTNRFLKLLTSDRGRPLVVAHRGASALAPENTLEAARLGWQAGADAWELDVQLSRDGVAVVVHDETLVRTTDVAVRYAGDPRSTCGFRVLDFDWWEIRTLDAGSWFPEVVPALREEGIVSRQESIRIPSLTQALRLTAELDWLVNVEIKSFPESPPGLVEAVLNAIDETETADRVLLSSFDHSDLRRVAELLPSSYPGLGFVPRGALAATPLVQPHRYVRELVGAQTYHLSARCLGADSVGYRRRASAARLRGGEIEGLKSHGIPMLVYTVNDGTRGGLAEHLAELGIDGVFSDDPASLVSLFGSDRKRA
jgi:glycerophosphoryl diester phosphodiesterase